MRKMYTRSLLTRMSLSSMPSRRISRRTSRRVLPLESMQTTTRALKRVAGCARCAGCAGLAGWLAGLAGLADPVHTAVVSLEHVLHHGVGGPKDVGSALGGK